jgi:heat-inducible transcriptional repressor
MAKPPHDRRDPDLAPREMEILKSVIREHVLTGEPVGSRTLSRERGLDLSPATIRNIMSDLEERGFLSQPHASAGRLPTDRAWRLYVDRLMPPGRISSDHLHTIDEALVRARGEIPELLAEACRQLSRFSSQVGVVLAPELRRIVIEHLEFVRLEGPRVVAILVDRSGVVHNRILEVAEPLEQRELDRIGRELSAQFAGMTLPAMRDAVSKRIAEARAAYDEILAKGLELGRLAVSADPAGADLFLDGASNLLSSPEFGDLVRARELLRVLEERGRLHDLLDRVLEGDGIQVMIGAENPGPELSNLSVVAAPYRAGDRVLGTVGIVGPTRMEYARAIALVEHLTRVLSRLLTIPEN